MKLFLNQVYNFVKRDAKQLFSALFPCLIFGFVVLHLFLSVVLPASIITSLPFYGAIIVLFLWFIFSVVYYDLMRTRRFRQKTMLKQFLPLGLLVLIVFTSFVSLFVTSIKYSALLNIDYCKKYISFISSLVFAYCCFKNKTSRIVAIFCVALSALLSSILLLVFIFKFDDVFIGQNRTLLTLYLSNPNFAAIVLTSLACFLLYGVTIIKNFVLRITLVILSFLVFVMLYLTGSRGSLLAFVLSVALYFLLICFSDGKKILSSKNVLFLLLMLPLLFILFYIPAVHFYNTFFKPDAYIVSNTKSLASRFEIWIDGFKTLIADAPVSIIFGAYGKFNGLFQFHNAYLDTWVAYGFITLVLTISFLQYLLMNITSQGLIKSKSQIIAMCFLVCTILTGVAEASFLSSGSGVFVFGLMFLLFAKEPLSNDLLKESNYRNNFETPKKLDILIVNSVFGRGSTGKIVQTLYEEYSKTFNVGVAYGRYSINVNFQNVFKITSEFESAISHFLNNIIKDQYNFNFFSTLALLKIIKKYKPQVIHLHCLNDSYINNYLLLHYLKKHKIPTVVTLHAENLFIGQCGGHAFKCIEWQKNPGCKNCYIYPMKQFSYRVWKKLKDVFDGFDNIVFCSVSQWLESQAQISSILKNKEHKVVLNGLSDELYSYMTNIEAKQKFNISNKNVVLSVSASYKNPNKGFDKFIELAKMFSDKKDYLFVYLSGDEVKINVPNNVLLLKSTLDIKDLADIYTMADVSVITSKWETFSMPTAESLFCGTPVCGFNAGGPETISIPAYSSFVEWGDCLKLKDEILKTIEKKHSRKEIKEIARNKYSSSRMCKQYLDIYKEICGNMLSTSKYDAKRYYSIEI